MNSRYKDFYDICVLTEIFDFDGSDIKEAISETFKNRGTSFEIIAAFEEGFAADTYRKGRWKGFLKSKHVDRDMTLEEVIGKIKVFLLPVIESIQDGVVFDKMWKCESQKWQTPDV